jgi:hypothetical protein
MAIGAGEFEFDDRERALAPLWTIGGDAKFRGDWFPLHFDRLLNSEFMCAVPDAAKFSALVLWSRSLRQIPVATLPADHVQLARLADFGRDVEAWRAIAAGALYGWRLVRVEGIDGDEFRLGHSFVAGVAAQAMGLMDAADGRRADGTASKSRARLCDALARLGCVPSEIKSPEFVAAVEAELQAGGPKRRNDADLAAAIDRAGRALAHGVTPLRARGK